MFVLPESEALVSATATTARPTVEEGVEFHMSPHHPSSGISPACKEEAKILQWCDQFACQTLINLEEQTLAICTGSMRQRFVSAASRRTLEYGLTRVYNFLSNLHRFQMYEFDSRSTESAVSFETLFPRSRRSSLRMPKRPERPPLSDFLPKTDDDVDKEEAKRLQYEIERLKKEFRAAFKDAEARRNQITAPLRELEVHREAVAARVMVARKALENARANLINLHRIHLSEVRSYNTPPETVERVMEGVLTVLGEPQASNWEFIKRFIMKDDFTSIVRSFDPHKITLPMITKVNSLINHPSLTPEKVERASKALPPLLQWLFAIRAFAAILFSDEGNMEQELAGFDAEIARLKGILDDDRSMVDDLERRLREMRRQHQTEYGDDAKSERYQRARAEQERSHQQMLLEWQRRCQVLAAKASASHRTRPVGGEMKDQMMIGKVPLVLSPDAARVVDSIRLRCDKVIKAINATISNTLDQNPLSVQRGALPTERDVYKNYLQSQKVAQKRRTASREKLFSPGRANVANNIHMIGTHDADLPVNPDGTVQFDYVYHPQYRQQSVRKVGSFRIRL